ncbi:MAG: hypothetical protein LIR50_07335 [Bacillota bacterium]|nr:hypothetical protein [Bacillota bacterium]
MLNDLIIFSAKPKAHRYEERFLAQIKIRGKSIQPRWSAVSLSDDLIDKITNGQVKYLALYRSMPLQYIEHYAKIDRIEAIDFTNINFKYEDITDVKSPRKYRIYLKDTKPISHKNIGNKSGRQFLNHKLSSLQKLLQATNLDYI